MRVEEKYQGWGLSFAQLVKNNERQLNRVRAKSEKQDRFVKFHYEMERQMRLRKQHHD